ncbi:MAG: FecR domain-containing protein [Bacteroidota bacterium]
MADRYDPTLFDALDPAEQDALRSALGDEADAAEALALWTALRAHLGAELRRDLPEFDLLLLWALGEDDPAVLAPEEEARLIAARPALEAALGAHPALGDIVRRVRADRAAFDAAWDEAEQTAEPPSPLAERAPDRRPARASGARRWVWRSAVALSVAAFAAVLVFILQRDAGFETYRTGAGETETVALADGSTVLLAEASRLMVDTEDDGERRVRLTGEALFEILPNGEPFVVETATALTTVLGTTFGVTANDVETEVVLASGSVELATRLEAGQSVRLEPGHRSRVVGAQAPEPPTRTDIAEALAWTGTWHFQATPLGDIAERLSAHYAVPINVHPSLAADRVTGPFSSRQPVAETLRTLAVALDAQVEGDEANGYRIVPAR